VEADRQLSIPEKEKGPLEQCLQHPKSMAVGRQTGLGDNRFPCCS